MRGAPGLLLVAMFVVVGCGGGSVRPTQTTDIVLPTAPGSTFEQVLPTRAPQLTPTPTRTSVVPTGQAPVEDAQRARVVDVVDGDTIRVRIDGVEYPVRYIGIDAPERGDPLGRAATNANAQLVEGKRVWLESDVSATDQFERLLRHVWLRDDDAWLLVSSEIVSLGLAYARSYPPDELYDSLLASAQEQAEAAEAGIWAQPRGLVGPIDTPKPVSPTEPPRDNSGRCHRSYPDVCIPPAPPDLDCGQIPDRRFEVLPPDPHGFDGDFDGIGCESG